MHTYQTKDLFAPFQKPKSDNTTILWGHCSAQFPSGRANNFLCIQRRL